MCLNLSLIALSFFFSTACPEGRYRAGISNSSCLLCPNNSVSTEEGSAVCPCVPPNIRNPTRPQDPCTGRLFNH